MDGPDPDRCDDVTNCSYAMPGVGVEQCDAEGLYVECRRRRARELELRERTNFGGCQFEFFV